MAENFCLGHQSNMQPSNYRDQMLCPIFLYLNAFHQLLCSFGLLMDSTYLNQLLFLQKEIIVNDSFPYTEHLFLWMKVNQTLIQFTRGLFCLSQCCDNKFSTNLSKIIGQIIYHAGKHSACLLPSSGRQAKLFE